MKPINSKEKNKKLGQFLIIFLGLAIIPIALIFYSYYKVPDKISESEERKLIDYSNFDHTQKMITKKMSELDSTITLYASATTPNPELLGKKIVDGLADLSKMDTSIKMVKLTSDEYANHYTHVKELVAAQEKLKKSTLDLQEAQTKLKSAESNMMMMGSRGGAPAMPPVPQ